jgi:hypothetical protein
VPDEDPKYDRRVVPQVTAVATTLDGSPAAHARGVLDIYAAAWASCMRGRVTGVGRRTGTRTSAAAIATDRRNTRVAARLALAWMNDLHGPMLEDGYLNDALRVQMGVSTAILRVTSSRGFPPEHVATLRSLCGAGDVVMLDFVTARVLAEQDDPAWQALRTWLAYYGAINDDEEEKGFNSVVLDRVEKAWKQAGLGTSKVRFTSLTTQNLYNRVGFADRRAPRELDNADVDAFVDHLHLEHLDHEPYDLPDPSARPTPMMLGVFPHPSPSPEGPEGPVAVDVEDLFSSSLGQLQVLGDQMRSAGFTTTAPLMDHAYTQVEDQLQTLLLAPLGQEVAGPIIAATSPTTTTTLVDIWAEGHDDELEARKALAATATDLAMDYVRNHIELAVGVRSAEESDPPVDGLTSDGLVDYLIRIAWLKLHEGEQ